MHMCFRCWLLIWRIRLLSYKKKNFLLPHQSSTFLTLVHGDATHNVLFFLCIGCCTWLNMSQFVEIIHRLFNYEPLTPLRMVRASVFGRLVCVRGTVVRVSSIRPLCTRMAFRCLGCSHTLSLLLQQGKFATPTKVHKTKHRYRFLAVCNFMHITWSICMFY